jgi:hypothetical protein
MILSPGYAAWMFTTGFGLAPGGRAHSANLCTLAYSILLIFAAGLLMGRSWRQGEFSGTGRFTLRERWLHRVRERRKALAKLWLESEPYGWLAARKADPFIFLWLFLGAVLVLWTIAFCAWGTRWLRPINMWATAFIIASGLRWMIHYAAARQIAEDRATGTLELILTSTLPPEKIVSGQEAVLKRQARPVFIALAAAYATLFLLGTYGNTWTRTAAISYACIWVFVAAFAPWRVGDGVWRTFWMALNTGRSGFALRKFLYQGMGFTGIGVQILINGRKLAGLPYGTDFELLICGLVAFCTLLFFGGSRFFTYPSGFRPRAIAELREVAAEPLPDPADPRLKSWNGDAPLFHDPPEKIVV